MDNTEILDQIEQSKADPILKKFAVRLVIDAIARKQHEGEFDLYGAMAGKSGDPDWAQLYGNPTDSKYEFMKVIHLIGILTDAKFSAMIMEAWYLDTKTMSKAKAEEAREQLHSGLSVSDHPDAREAIFINIEGDDEGMHVKFALRDGGYEDIIVDSSADHNLNAEGALTGLRVPPEIRAKAREHIKERLDTERTGLEKEWMIGEHAIN